MTEREKIAAFARESNHIEGIARTTARHIAAHMDFLEGAVHIPALVKFVGEVQPNARFRNEAHVPGVRVGNHVAPPSGPEIEAELRRILAMRDPWEQHIAYETLHPFTDGNGRSGRDVSNISRHITSILDEGELDEATSLRKSQTSLGRPATLYSLDMVISVGYRVASEYIAIPKLVG